MNPVQAVRSALRPGRMMMAVVLGTALTAGHGTAGASDDTLNDLSRYCTACWRNARLPADCWGDCTQEVLARLLESVPAGAWDRTLAAEGDERREFLRAIDAVKKRVQRARKFANNLDSVADVRTVSEVRLAEERETVHSAAREVLTPRQQQILQWSMEGWSVQEVAEELGIGPERVSDEKYKAIRKLREHLGTQCEEMM